MPVTHPALHTRLSTTVCQVLCRLYHALLSLKIMIISLAVGTSWLLTSQLARMLASGPAPPVCGSHSWGQPSS